MGQPWEQEAVELNLIKLEIRAESHGESAAARAWFVLANRSNERLLVEVDFGHI